MYKRLTVMCVIASSLFILMFLERSPNREDDNEMEIQVGPISIVRKCVQLQKVPGTN